MVSFINFKIDDHFWNKELLKAHVGRCTELKLCINFVFFLLIFQTWQELRMVAWGCSSGVTPSRSSASEVQATPESPGYDSTTRETRLESHSHTVWTEHIPTSMQTSDYWGCIVMWGCQFQQHFHTSFHKFAIQAWTTVGSLASAHIVLQLSDSTALNSGTRLKLIIFSDGAFPMPALSYLPVLAKRVKYAFKKWEREEMQSTWFQLCKWCLDLGGW